MDQDRRLQAVVLLAKDAGVERLVYRTGDGLEVELTFPAPGPVNTATVAVPTSPVIQATPTVETRESVYARAMRGTPPRLASTHGEG